MATALVLVGLPSAALARTVDGGWQPIDVQTCGAAAPTCDTGMQPVAKFARVGSTVDATSGALRLTVQNARDGRDAIDVSGGMFVFRQVAKGKQRGRTLLELRTAQPNLCAAPGATRCCSG